MTKPEERWARMRELFDGARTVPAMQRDAYLDRVCNDADMREEVAGMHPILVLDRRRCLPTDGLGSHLLDIVS